VSIFSVSGFALKKNLFRLARPICMDYDTAMPYKKTMFFFSAPIKKRLIVSPKKKHKMVDLKF
jgi:hypothetical protein